MKKTILYFLSVMIGITMGVLLHCSFMVLEAKGCYMLPTIEPEQQIMVSLLDKDIDIGDVVAFETPYYTLNGEGNIIFRRVEQVVGDEVMLTCDASLTEVQRIKIPKGELLGKVILLGDK